VVKLYSFKRNPLHEAQGVQEYWIVDAEEEVEPYVLTTTGRKQSYTLQCKGQAGTVQAQAIPGLMLPIEALFDEGAYRQTLSGLRA
jgi:Uma2 family endonuclease